MGRPKALYKVSHELLRRNGDPLAASAPSRAKLIGVVEKKECDPSNYVDQYGSSAAGAASAPQPQEDVVRVPVHEEHLAASKRRAQAGEVTIAKRVVTERETIEVPVSRAVVDVRKRTVQTGQLEVTKEREQRTQQVTDSVRREVVEVDDTAVEGELGNR